MNSLAWKRNRIHMLIAMLISLFLLASACTGAEPDAEETLDDATATDTDTDAGGETPADDATDDDAEETAAERTGGTLTVAIENLGSENWAPWEMGSNELVVHRLVNEYLILLDPATAEPVPGLATEWELSEDLSTWTFRLREGVQFHDDWGEMTADDVKFSWEQFIREDSLTGRASVLRDAVGGDMDNFEIVNDYEFRIHMPEPNVILDDFVTLGDTMHIQSRDYWESVGEEEASRQMIGTGPFRFDSHNLGVDVTLQAVEDHWRVVPSYDTLVFRIVEDESARVAQLATGEVDIAPVSFTQLPEVEAAGGKVFEIEEMSVSLLKFGGLYPHDPALLDADAPYIQADNPEQGLAIRQAMSLAMDRQSIVDNILAGRGFVAEGPLFWAFPSTSSPQWEGMLEYDVDRARELMAEGGYPDGFEVNLPIFPQGGRPASEDIAEAVAGMLEEIGITVNRMPMEFSPTFRQHIENRTTIEGGHIYQFTTSFFREPLNQVRNGYTEGGGISHYTHPAITEYVNEASQTPTPEGRRELALEMGDVLMEEMTSIPLVTTSTLFAATQRVAEFPMVNGSASDYNHLEFVQLTE